MVKFSPPKAWFYLKKQKARVAALAADEAEYVPALKFDDKRNSQYIGQVV